MSFTSYYSFQFISLDGTRSAFDDSEFKNSEFKDFIVPQGKQIRKVETMLSVSKGKLKGFKWIGDDEEVLLAFGEIDDPYLRNQKSFNLVTIMTLNRNQRIIGVKSCSSEHKIANHRSF